MTAAEKIAKALTGMTNGQIELAYGSVFRMWANAGKTDRALADLMRTIEGTMDDRGMDTDAIIDRTIG